MNVKMAAVSLLMLVGCGGGGGENRPMVAPVG